jgi:hypothetical protein
LRRDIAAAAAAGALMDWYSIKIAVVEQTDLSRDALHIFAGVAGQILVALVIRRGLGHFMPWLAVLAAELVNEYFDLTEGDVWGDTPMWPGTVRDIFVTMAIPTLLLFLVRYAPGMFARAPGRGKRK